MTVVGSRCLLRVLGHRPRLATTRRGLHARLDVEECVVRLSTGDSACAYRMARAPVSRTGRRSSAHQIRSVGDSSETDVLRRDAKRRSAKKAFRFLHRFPPLFERRQIPPAAMGADYPEPALRRVECETPANRKMLQRLIAAERARAEHAGAVHRGPKVAMRSARRSVHTLILRSP